MLHTPPSPPIAIITGASRGIGQAIARRLAHDGYQVGIHYGTNQKAAAAVAADITAAGGAAFTFQADLTHVADFWPAFDHATEGMDVSNLRVLVNNAGITLCGIIEDFSPADFETQQTINVTAPYFIVRDGLSRMVDGGRIINISSGVTRIAFPHIIGYAMTKGAIDTFTRTLAKHLGPRRITVNAVAPGVVDTDINADWLRGNTDVMAAIAADVALGRVGQPEDIAGIVSFLASDDAAWVTGHIIDATGGTHL